MVTMVLAEPPARALPHAPPALHAVAPGDAVGARVTGERTVVSQQASEERTELVALLSATSPELLPGMLLRTREVALLFQVSERAVTEWAKRGRIRSVRTPGGHRRYPAEQVRELLGIEVDGRR